MKLSDRIAEFKAQATNTPEGKTKAIKLGIGAGCLVLALGVVVVRLMLGGSAKPEADRTVTPQLATQVETMAKELEQAQEEENESFDAAVAAGEAPAPEVHTDVVRKHPKGTAYIPGSASDPAFQPAQPSEPDPSPEPEHEDPG